MLNNDETDSTIGHIRGVLGAQRQEHHALMQYCVMFEIMQHGKRYNIQRSDRQGAGLNCATGRRRFLQARHFRQVIGMDYSSGR